MKLKSRRSVQAVLIVVGFVILSVPLWLKIDHLPIRLWDEARNAVNALEMFESGDLTTRTFNNQPETYNLKPPMLTWLQVLSFRVFGVNELGVRFPSLVASLVSLFLVFVWVFLSTKSKWFGFLAIGVTVTSSAFYGEHVSRFGDHDALLIAFSLLFLIAVYKYSITKQTKFLYIGSTLLAAGVLTKSVTILMFLPGVFLFLLLTKNGLPTLKNKHFYLSVLLFFVGVGSYYLLREFNQPGYLSFVWNDELFPRYLNKSKNLTFQEPDTLYYINLLVGGSFSYWFWLIPIAVVSLVLNKLQNNGFLLACLSAFSFLAIISKGTSNFWYMAPIVPLLAVFVSIGLFTLIKNNKKLLWISPLLILGCLFYPYKVAYSYALRSTEPHYNLEPYGISYYLKNELYVNNLSSKNYILLDSVYGFEPHLFYSKNIERTKGVVFERKHFGNIKLGDTLLITHNSTYNWLQKQYSVKTLDSINSYTKRVWIQKKAKK